MDSSTNSWYSIPASSDSVCRRDSTISIVVEEEAAAPTRPQQQFSANKRRASTQQQSPSSSSSPWCSVPQHEVALTQQQQDIADQCSNITPGTFLALVGPRGVGKATLVSQAIQPPALWLHAHSESTLRASYIAVLRQCNNNTAPLAPQSTRQLADAVARVVLSQPPHTLVVYQDVGVAPDRFREEWAIRASSSCSVLLTTTLTAYQSWNQGNFQSMEVPAQLSVQEARQLLFQNSPHLIAMEDEDEDSDLQALVTLLHHLPLAVRIAGALPLPKIATVDQLVQHLQTAKEEQSTDSSLHWFWSLAVDQVSTIITSSEDPLNVLGLVHHDCIPEALLLWNPHEHAIHDVPLLEQWNIVTRTTPHSFSIAPGLQQAIRTRQPPLQLSDAIPALKACLSAKPPPESYWPHVDALQSHHIPNNDGRQAHADVLLQMGLLLQRDLADYDKAIALYRQGLQVLGDDTENNKNLAKSLYYRLGTCARLQGDHKQAKEYCLKALALLGYHNLEPPQQSAVSLHPTPEYNILSQLFHICGHASWQNRQVVAARVYFEHELAVKQNWYQGRPHDRVARTLNNLGSVCRDAGDWKAAREYSLQSLQMQNQMGHTGNLEMATTLNNLGSLSYSLCEYASAQDFLEQALAMKQTCYPSTEVQNLDVAETYYNLGMLADHLSHYDKAQEHYEASLQCKYAVFSTDAKNAQIATSLSSLALSAMNHGHYQKSEQYYQQALEMQREFYHNEGNMEMVRTLHGLGILNYHRGKMEESRLYHRQALEMQQEFEAKEKKRQGPTTQALSDPRTANLSQIMQNLGNLAHNLGEYDNAREFYEQGLKLYSQVSVDSAKDEHLERMLGDLQNLSSTSSYDAARNYYEKALEMKYFVYGEKTANTDLAFTLRSLALLNDNAGQHEEAKECYEKALKMLHRFYGGKEAANAEIAGVLDGLGTVNFNLGDYPKSKDWLQQALTMKETVYADANNNDLATSHVSLGTLAHTLGSYEEARQHLETAHQMQLAVFGDSAGEQNIELGVTANSLANLYKDLGETEKALAMYEQATQLMGKDNPFQASALTDLGEFYRQQGDHDKATSCLLEAMRLQNKLYGEDIENAEVATLAMHLGKLYTDMGNHDEAQSYLDCALNMQRRVLGDHHGDDENNNVVHGEIADTLQALGDLMLAKGDPESAREYLEQAKTMRLSLYGDVKTLEMAETVHSLGMVYMELNDTENAEKCQKELEELRANAPQVSKALGRTQQKRAERSSAKRAKEVQMTEGNDMPQPRGEASTAKEDQTKKAQLSRERMKRQPRQEGKTQGPKPAETASSFAQKAQESPKLESSGNAREVVTSSGTRQKAQDRSNSGNAHSGIAKAPAASLRGNGRGRREDELVGTILTVADEEKGDGATLGTEISSIEDSTLYPSREKRVPKKKPAKRAPKQKPAKKVTQGRSLGVAGQHDDSVHQEVDQRELALACGGDAASQAQLELGSGEGHSDHDEPVTGSNSSVEGGVKPEGRTAQAMGKDSIPSNLAEANGNDHDKKKMKKKKKRQQKAIEAQGQDDEVDSVGSEPGVEHPQRQGGGDTGDDEDMNRGTVELSETVQQEEGQGWGANEEEFPPGGKQLQEREQSEGISKGAEVYGGSSAQAESQNRVSDDKTNSPGQLPAQSTQQKSNDDEKTAYCPNESNIEGNWAKSMESVHQDQDYAETAAASVNPPDGESNDSPIFSSPPPTDHEGSKQDDENVAARDQSTGPNEADVSEKGMDPDTNSEQLAEVAEWGDDCVAPGCSSAATGEDQRKDVEANNLSESQSPVVSASNEGVPASSAQASGGDATESPSADEKDSAGNPTAATDVHAGSPSSAEDGTQACAASSAKAPEKQGPGVEMESQASTADASVAWKDEEGIARDGKSTLGDPTESQLGKDDTVVQGGNSSEKGREEKSVEPPSSSSGAAQHQQGDAASEEAELPSDNGKENATEMAEMTSPQPKGDQGERKQASLKRDASRKKLKKGKRRSSIAEKQPGEEPRMDWTDKKLVKRESMRVLEEKKQKLETSTHDESNKPSEEDRMDWSDKNVVRRESQRYLEKKQKEEAAARGTSTKPAPQKGSKDLKSNTGSDSKDSKSAGGGTKGKETRDAKPKLEKKWKSRPNVNVSKEGKPKLEKRTKSITTMTAGGSQEKAQGGKTENDKANQPKLQERSTTKSNANERKASGKAATQTNTANPKVQGSTQSKSKGQKLTTAVTKKKNPELPQSEEDEKKKPKSKPEADTKGPKQAAGLDKNGNIPPTINKERSQKAVANGEAAEGEKEEKKYQAETTVAHLQSGKRIDLAASRDASDADVEEERTEYKQELPDEKQETKSTDAGSDGEKEQRKKKHDTKAPMKDQSKKRSEKEDHRKKDTKVTEKDEGKKGEQQQRSEKEDQRKKKNEAKDTEKDESKKSQSSDKEEQTKKGTNVTPRDGDALLMQDPLDISEPHKSSATTSSKRKKRGSMSDVSDMPPGVRDQEAEATTCACWPFSLRK